MRRSAISRRTNRSEVPSRSAACSTVNSVSNFRSFQCAGERSCGSSHGRGGQLLAGDPSSFTGAGGGRQRQPHLALGLVAGADVAPGGDDDGGLVVVLDPAPGVQRYPIASTAALGVGDAGAAQGGHGGGV